MNYDSFNLMEDYIEDCEDAANRADLAYGTSSAQLVEALDKFLDAYAYISELTYRTLKAWKTIPVVEWFDNTTWFNEDNFTDDEINEMISATDKYRESTDALLEVLEAMRTFKRTIRDGFNDAIDTLRSSDSFREITDIDQVYHLD